MRKEIIIFTTILVAQIAFCDNLVPNGGFENWTAGVADSWTPNPDTNTINAGYPLQESSDVYEGTYSAEWKWNKADNNVNVNTMSKSDMFPITEGERYILQATFKPLSHNIGNGQIEILMGVADSTTGNHKFWIEDDSNNTAKIYLYWGSFDSTVAVGSNYVTRSVEFTVPALVPNRSGRLYMLNRYWRGGRILLDHVSVAPPPPGGTVIIIK
jgi:hypothetical protein